MAAAGRRNYKKGQEGVVTLRTRHTSRIVFLSVAVIVTFILIGSFVRVLQDVPFRQAFVLSSDPMRIISWDKDRLAMQIVSLPADILISGALGYGQYSLGALSTLDTLDHKNGLLLGQSVAQAFGIPIKGVIFLDAMAVQPSVVSSLKKQFSWRSLVSRLFGRVGTTVSFADWIHIVFVVHALGTDDIELVDLSTAVSDVVRPDGVSVRVFDQQKADYIIGNTLHDAKLRNENKTVTIINTTTSIGIGSQVARMINRFGIQVVSVGNDAEMIANCQLQTMDQKIKTSLTYQFLKAYFGCSEKVLVEDGEVSDITLRLGTEFATLFQTAEQ